MGLIRLRGLDEMGHGKMRYTMAANRKLHTHPKKFLIVVSLVVGAILLSYLAKILPTLPGDMFVTELFQGGRWWFFHRLFVFTSTLGSTPAVLLTTTSIVALFLFYKMPKAGLFTLSTLLNHPVNIMIKAFIQRPRPTEDVVTIFEKLSSYSFPSGHVMHFTVFYGFVLFVALHTKRLPQVLRTFLVFICGFFIAFIGPARIFLGAHWFSDVLGGYIFGAVLLIPLIAIYHRYTKP